MGRHDTARQIVAICIKNSVHPQDNRFGGVVRKICAARFAYSKGTARNYAETLFSAYQFDRWEDLVEGNTYLTPEEKEEWLEKISEN